MGRVGISARTGPTFQKTGCPSLHQFFFVGCCCLVVAHKVLLPAEATNMVTLLRAAPSHPPMRAVALKAAQAVENPGQLGP